MTTNSNEIFYDKDEQNYIYHPDIDPEALRLFKELLIAITKNDLAALKTNNIIAQLNVYLENESSEFKENGLQATIEDLLMRKNAYEKGVYNEALVYAIKNLSYNKYIKRDLIWRLNMAYLDHLGTAEDKINYIYTFLNDDKVQLFDYQIAQLMGVAFSMDNHELINIIFNRFNNSASS